MKLFSYVVARDFGFAPNPFGGICTLATCKPGIRKTSNLNDWVIGIGSKRHNASHRLIYAMQVSEKITYNEYWEAQRFRMKRPYMNGSLKQTYGDNIYFHNEELNEWQQANSHHSLEDGSVNMLNLNRDTKSSHVLIADYFFYFGKNHVEIPDHLLGVAYDGRGYKYSFEPALVLSFLEWLQNNYQPGYHGDPIQFDGNFIRYNGRD
jgi:hypothetical protein